MQDLVHDRARERLHGRPCLRGDVGEPGQGLADLALPDPLQALAQRHDRGNHLDVGQPGAELRDLALDQALCALRLARPLADVGLHDLLEVVDVVAVDVVEGVDRGLDVPGHRDVDEEQRAAAPAVHRALDHGVRDHGLG